MALDRTWYNTLVDDDGSGLTGTPWNKASVDAILDAVDARVTDWIDVPYNAANFFGAGGMVWTVDAGDVLLNRYCRSANAMIWAVCLAPTSISGTPGPALFVNFPAGIAALSTNNFAPIIPIGTVNGYVAPYISGTALALYNGAGANWPLAVNGIYTYFTWIGQVTP